MFIYYILSALAGAVLALAIYVVARRIFLKGRRDEIIEKAELEAENIKKEKKWYENCVCDVDLRSIGLRIGPKVK